MAGLAILGSARSDGHTARALGRLIDDCACTVYDLNEVRLAPFKYAQDYQEDVFLDIARAMTAAPVTILATPVYWYSYSAIMKSFIDRISDLLLSHKVLGRQLRGRSFVLLTTSSTPEPDPDLVSSFRRLCGYLGVQYIGCVHAVEDGPFVDPEFAAEVRRMLSDA